MIFSALVIAVVAALAYIWASRGFFSALIHMVCTIIAGAIAFALWEPVAYLIIGSDTSKDGWLTDLAWGAALGLPFAIALAVLRLGIDALLGKNVDLDGATNLIGGGVCGAVSGTITAGIFVISLSSLRMQTTIMGYEPFTFDNNGSLVRSSGLIYPADRLTAWFYSTLSDSTFRTDNNLATWRPNLADEGALLRINHDEGKSKNVIKPDAFKVLGRYTLEAGQDTFNDTFSPKKYSYTYTDGTQALPSQSVIEGYVIAFQPAANEKSGRVIVGNGQLRLVVRKPDGETMGVQPIAVISEANFEDPKSKSGPPLGRWLFDGQKVFIATFNQRNTAPMAFEFPVPKGSEPLALYVKGNRVVLNGEEGAPKIGTFATYRSISERDAAIANRSITPSTAAEELDTSTAVKVNPARWSGEVPMRVSDAIPYNIVLQKDDVGGLEIGGSGRNLHIISGEAKFLNERLSAVRGADPNLQVRRLGADEDIAIVHVVVDGKNTQFGFLSDAAANIDRDKAPLIVDETGQRYACYGYVYQSPTETHITYTPQAAISSLSGLPTITKSQPNDKMTLLFRTGKNVKIKYFVVGGKVVAEFDKPYDVKKQ